MTEIRRKAARPSRHTLTLLFAALLTAIGVVWVTPAFGNGEGVNLLSGKQPTRSEGVTRADKLTDERSAPVGDFWKTNRTTVFRSPAALVEYDLGEPQHITAGYLLGDNNDTYIISGSMDGQSFQPLWDAGPVGGSGLQPRSVDNLNVTARYVRVSARGGDASYALSELMLFNQKPAVFPPKLPESRGVPPDEGLRNAILTFGTALVVFAVFAHRGAPIWWTILLALLPLWTGYSLSTAIRDAWPVGQREIALLRGITALVALLVVAREAFAPARFRANVGVVIATLSVCASLAIACFYNLGRPQYVDHKLGTPSFVHNFDMRVYYPVAKYFDELRFDGLYQGSVAAYAADDPSVTLDSLGHVQLRDLKTHKMTRVSDVRQEIEAVQQRFSPERWQEFVRDMRYFRENMGVRDYLGSMSDHGGNATPVWLGVAQLIFAKTTASNTTLFWAAMLDPLLLLIAFLAIGRTFGIRTMLVSMVIFGANDFYMFGTNWAGATLRHDWMAYLALGLCALKRERWMLGGALLALSAMIRAFPAMALVALGIYVFWWGYDRFRATRRLPRPKEIWQAQKPFFRVALGATLAVLVLFLASSALLGFGAWPEWLHKVHLLNRDPHVNHVSWRGLVAGPDGVHIRILLARSLVFYGGIAAFVALIALAARRRDLAVTATLGLLLVPLVFHPANYYIHLVFLLPLVARELSGKGDELVLGPGEAMMWVAFLGICTFQYWTTRVEDLGMHFHLASALLFVGITVGLFGLIAQNHLEQVALRLGLPLRDTAALWVVNRGVPAALPGAPAEAAEPELSDHAGGAADESSDGADAAQSESEAPAAKAEVAATDDESQAPADGDREESEGAGSEDDSDGNREGEREPGPGDGDDDGGQDSSGKRLVG